MALYQFYNADLVEIPNDEATKYTVAYVDNVILVTITGSFEETHERLKDMMTRNGGESSWAKQHNSSFEYNKLALIDFTHSSKVITRTPLALPEITLTLVASIKYLGIMLDQKLNWKEQVAYTQEKGSKWAVQICRVARPS
jgi:hypothetical protein